MDEDADVYIEESDDFCPIHCETCEGGYDPWAGYKNSDEEEAESSSDQTDDAQFEEKIGIYRDDQNSNIKVNLAGGVPADGIRELLLVLGDIKCNEVTVLNGKAEECKQIHTLLEAPLLYQRVPTLSFEKCCFGLETIRLLLLLLTKPSKRSWTIKFHECRMSEEVNEADLLDELIQFAKENNLNQLGVIGHSYARLDATSVNFSSYTLVYFTNRTTKVEDDDHHHGMRMQNGEEDGGFPISTCLSQLMRFIQQVNTLQRLDLSNMTLPGQAIVQICDCLLQFLNNRKLELVLGGWEKSSLDAHRAVCELIKRGPAIKSLILSDKINQHSYLPIDMLGNALSDSIYLTYFSIQLDSHKLNYQQSLEFVNELNRLVKYPNRLQEISCDWFHEDHQIQQQFRLAQVELNTRLGKMQTREVFVLINLIYFVSIFRNKSTGNAPITLLNIDVIRKLAGFLFKTS